MRCGETLFIHVSPFSLVLRGYVAGCIHRVRDSQWFGSGHPALRRVRGGLFFSLHATSRSGYGQFLPLRPTLPTAAECRAYARPSLNLIHAAPSGIKRLGPAMPGPTSILLLLVVGQFLRQQFRNLCSI